MSGGAHDHEAAAGVEAQVREAVAAGRGIAGEVERITREALSSGRLDLERTRAVIEAVGRGASAGAEGLPERGRSAVSEAFEGLQNTLIRSAGDARLALEEAASNIGQWSGGEFERRLEEIRVLETMMLDSLARTAKSSSEAGAATLDDLVAHARRSGTRLGTEIEASMRILARSLPEALREVVLAGIGAARESGARAAEVASGVLSGVASALRETNGAAPRPGESESDRGDGGDRGPGGGASF